MNKVDYLIDVVKRQIPPEVIYRAFYNPVALAVIKPSIEYTIRSRILAAATSLIASGIVFMVLIIFAIEINIIVSGYLRSYN